jgi:hypothetical protein
VVGDSLELMTELLSRFGGLLAADHANISAAVLPHLDDSRALIRKRALHCLGKWLPLLSPPFPPTPYHPPPPHPHPSFAKRPPSPTPYFIGLCLGGRGGRVRREGGKGMWLSSNTTYSAVCEREYKPQCASSSAIVSGSEERTNLGVCEQQYMQAVCEQQCKPAVCGKQCNNNSMGAAVQAKLCEQKYKSHSVRPAVQGTMWVLADTAEYIWCSSTCILLLQKNAQLSKVLPEADVYIYLEARQYMTAGRLPALVLPNDSLPLPPSLSLPCIPSTSSFAPF